MLLGLNADCVPLGLGLGLEMDVIILATFLRVVIRELIEAKFPSCSVGPDGETRACWRSGEQNMGYASFTYTQMDAEAIPLSPLQRSSDTE